MAGCQVLFANEFVEAARQSYKANCADYTIVDDRDIRKLTAQDVLDAIGMKQGDLDIMDGSPPCSAFSTAGKREKGWGEVKKYSDTAQVADDLFFEYARIIEGVRPRAFVAENVSGLIKGAAKGYFKEILAALKACGYRVKAKLLDAQWLGVPQVRQRLIFIGIRDDLGIDPIFPEPLRYRYSIKDALPWNPEASSRGMDLVEAESDMSKYAVGKEWQKLRPGEQSDKYFQLVRVDPDKPCGTITSRGGDASVASVAHPTECRKFSIQELRAICGFPPDFELTGTYAQRWERLGRSVPPVMMSHIAKSVERALKNA